MNQSRRLQHLLLGGAALAAVAGTLALLAAHAWWLELFAHFRPQYALVLAACSLALLALSRRPAGALCLLLAAVNAAPLAHYYRPPPAAAAGGTPFKAVFANVYFGNRDYERVRALLRAERPDLAVFTEVTAAWASELATLADVLPYQAQAGEVLVASRRPLDALRPAALSNTGAGVLIWSAGDFTVIGGHANWPLGARIAAERNRELARLASLADGADRPLLVLADLNVTAFSPVFQQLLARGRLADCSAGRGWRPTWPTRFPPAAMQIDHCLHSAGFAIDAVRRGPYVGSDHYPLVVEGRVLPTVPVAQLRQAGAG